MNGAAPLVSLVMPAWCPRREWLLDAVDSALQQRDCPIELIVVDDGSPDPVASLLADVGDERLRIIRIEHGGEAAARNAGFALARGGFVRFVDADDVLVLDSCARLVAVSRGRGDLIAYGDTMHCDAALRPVWRMSERRSGRVLEQALLGEFHVRIFSLLFPRAIVEAVGGWDETMGLGTDWDFILRTLEHAEVAGDRVLATYYRRHEDSLTGRQRDRAESLNAAIVDRYFARHPEQRDTSLERRARASVHAIGARVHLTSGRPADGLRSLGRAMHIRPSAPLAQLRLGVRALRSRAAVRIGREPPAPRRSR